MTVRMAAVTLGVASWLLAASCATPARAEGESRAIAAPARESRWSLGALGFGGALHSEHEWGGGGGGGLLVAFGIVPERWELEFGLSAIGARNGALGVFEVIGKRIFARHGSCQPHLSVGPALSLEIDGELAPFGGALLGAGFTNWFATRVGWTGDAVYRLLIGAETEQVFTLALGLKVRL
jgi:hypothetical protein